MKKEPAVTVGVSVAVVAVVLGLLVFGLAFSAKQQAAVLALIAALAPIVSGFITRKHVTPVSKVEVR